MSRCQEFFFARAPKPIPHTSLFCIKTLTYLVRNSRQEGDLAELSAAGHFLKGSSATLGLTKVKDSCEKIQHYGQHKDETGTIDEPDPKKCLNLIQKTLDAVKIDYAEVEKVLRRYYHEHL